jgi:hypothetical protein
MAYCILQLVSEYWWLIASATRRFALSYRSDAKSELVLDTIRVEVVMGVN